MIGTPIGAAAASPRVAGVGTNIALLVGAALLAPAFLLLGLATGAWWLLLALAGGVTLAVVSLLDARVAIVTAVLLATFVDYNTGKLTVEFAILFAWLAWAALVILWRSAWKGWVIPRREMLPGLAVWLVVLAFGAIVGLLAGNSLRNIGLEVVAGLWPVAGFGIMQVYGRANARHAGLGLVAIALVHTVFGLSMLQIYHQRLGGIYFTTVTGFVALGLWTAALLAPTRRIRLLCLLGMIPPLTHLFFSFTRGYWLGFLVGLAVATLLAWRNLGRFEPHVRVRRLLLLPALLGVFVGTLAIAVLYFGGADVLASAGGRFGSSFSTQVSSETLSNVIRLDEYDKAIGAALQSPIFGRGLGFSFITRDILTRSIRDQWFVHNYYILLWLKLGIAGLAAFGILIASFMRAASRLAAGDGDWFVRAWSIGAIAVTVDLLVILTTNYSLADVTTASVIACVWGVFWSFRPAPATAPTSAPGTALAEGLAD
jgi:O-antigen ligase